MIVFIIEDDDTGDCYAFKNRKNAIDTMYYKCKDWGAILYVEIKTGGSIFSNSIALSKIYDTDEQKLNFLYQLSASELNNIFEAYWYFQECKVEDAEE